MTKNLPVDNFKWETNLTIFTEDFIKICDEESDIGYLLFVDVIYPKNLREKCKYWPFLPEKVKPNKASKLTCKITDKNNYPISVFALEQALNHGLILKKVHSVISFRQEAWLKPYIDMNTQLRTKAANEFEKDFYKLCNNSVYGKTMENVRKHRDIRLVKSDKKKKRNIIASDLNYHSTKCISEDLLIMEMKKREIYMNKPIYLGQAILDISKALMYEFWYDYLLPMYRENIKLCYMDTDSFIIYVKTNDFYKDISNDIDKWFHTSNYRKDIDRPLEKGKNKNVIDKFKDELGGLIMSEVCILRAKTYAFLLDGFTDNDYSMRGIINNKAEGTQTCVIKNKITFNDYVDVLFSDKKIKISPIHK